MVVHYYYNQHQHRVEDLRQSTIYMYSVLPQIGNILFFLPATLLKTTNSLFIRNIRAFFDSYCLYYQTKKEFIVLFRKNNINNRCQGLLKVATSY